ncbi:hypothetical protein EYZ11_000101 [Aspergillus tanneri]|uniref:WW domain-containing protein n=1 Tax=Aspergillus tanneri TaxID=1220188 RepID=A0A4S3JYA3_9EURO|nr:uncharacterized protein ATNIH1004_005683 [Aspergillus tanneri]KAA8647000.1 hypothetical protein ATNIH1004_005683 [Aspergillus tanneri]THD00374.1 hypothetical protein EYZ11_000101 [Aspergillus tanneri]
MSTPQHAADSPSGSPSGPSTERKESSPEKLEQEAQETESEKKAVQESERKAEPESEEKKDGKNQEQQNDNDDDNDDDDDESSDPPLPNEEPPPLPNEAPPGEDDGWEPVWDPSAQAYYFYNRFTGISQWENPRVPSEGVAAAAPADAAVDAEDADPSLASRKPAGVAGGYNPAIHGDYDPTAPYAQPYEEPSTSMSTGVAAAAAAAAAASAGVPGMDPTGSYAAVGAFNRFTGRWQSDAQNPELHNDDNKSRRQMYAFFDVDAAANSHDGRSLRAERSAKKLSRKELKMFKEKRREKKEEKRRAWLRD